MATTTADAIRDRILVVIEALIPKIDSHDRFRRYNSEGDGNFIKWAESFGAGALRRFAVAETGESRPPAVSNGDVEERLTTALVTIAYPQTHRTGAKNALDRYTAMDRDEHDVDTAIGMKGGANFAGAFPNATWMDGGPLARISSTKCDYVSFRITYRYWRAT